LNYRPPAESELVIKQSMVQRQSGMFSKWVDGFLVVTWDRYFHMFKKLEDADPAWSLNLYYAELLTKENKCSSYTIELRERRGLMTALMPKSYVFKAKTEEDFKDWTRILAVACAGENLSQVASKRQSDSALSEECSSLGFKPDDTSSVDPFAVDTNRLTDTTKEPIEVVASRTKNKSTTCGVPESTSWLETPAWNEDGAPTASVTLPTDNQTESLPASPFTDGINPFCDSDAEDFYGYPQEEDLF